MKPTFLLNQAMGGKSVSETEKQVQNGSTIIRDMKSNQSKDSRSDVFFIIDREYKVWKYEVSDEQKIVQTCLEWKLYTYKDCMFVEAMMDANTP
jgi:hypothetical protein